MFFGIECMSYFFYNLLLQVGSLFNFFIFCFDEVVLVIFELLVWCEVVLVEVIQDSMFVDFDLILQ